jgi:hypothetical protein
MRHRYQWNEEKNALLQKERSHCFEMVVEALEAGKLLGDMPHPDPTQFPTSACFTSWSTDMPVQFLVWKMEMFGS